MQWESSYGCPTSSFGWAWTFNVCFLAAVIIYLVGGAYYNKTTKGMRGLEALPHRDFWRELPGLVKEGTIFFFSKLQAVSSKARGKENL
jgi:hypothetical protein